jgi:hypothetical protein
MSYILVATVGENNGRTANNFFNCGLIAERKTAGVPRKRRKPQRRPKGKRKRLLKRARLEIADKGRLLGGFYRRGKNNRITQYIIVLGQIYRR